MSNKILFVVALLCWGTVTVIQVNKAIRLMELGHTSPEIISEGRSVTYDTESSRMTITLAKVVGNAKEFTTDGLYQKGDHAFLTYSDILDYGVITKTPPKTFYDIIAGNAETVHLFALGLLYLITGLTITNIGLIIFAILDHWNSDKIKIKITEAPSRFKRNSIIAKTVVQMLFAAILSLLPIATIIAAFTISIRIQHPSPWAIWGIYVVLVLFLVSHLSAIVAIVLLKFIQSKFAETLNGMVSLVGELAAVIFLLDSIIQLMFSDHILDLSSWREVGKLFIQTFLKQPFK